MDYLVEDSLFDEWVYFGWRGPGFYHSRESHNPELWDVEVVRTSRGEDPHAAYLSSPEDAFRRGLVRGDRLLYRGPNAARWVEEEVYY